MNTSDNQVAPGNLELVRTFLNTWRISNETRLPEDDLETPEAIQHFFFTTFGPLNGLLMPEQVHQLRADLRRVLGSSEIEVLNEWLARQPVEVLLDKDEKGLPIIKYKPTEASGCRLCAAILTLVVEAIAQHTWIRLKACPDCQWVFYDHTKNQNKVWCLMVAGGPQGRSCGSISKVRSFRTRQKTIKNGAEA